MAGKRTYIDAVVSRAAAAMSRRQRIGCVAGGSSNLGDALMMPLVRRLFPRSAVFSYLYPRVEQRLAACQLSGPKFFRAVTLAGGTLLNSYSLAIVECALRQRLPVFTLGTGVGRGGFDQDADVDWSRWRPLLADIPLLGVRGPISCQRLQDAGIHHAQVIGDLALYLARERPAPAAEPRRFAFNVIASHGYASFQEADLAPLRSAVRRLIADGWQPAPFAMHPTDAPAISQFLASLGCSIGAVPCYSSAEELLDALAPCMMCVSMRLHGSVLAACVGVPPISISYLDKCNDFMQSLDLGAFAFDVKRLDDSSLECAVQEIVRGGLALRETIAARALARRRAIEQHVAEACRTVGLSV